MSSETNGTRSESRLPRTREPGDPAKAGRRGFYATLDGTFWFRPLVIAVPVVVAGIVLAPRLAPRTYPADPNLIGSPASENIKAPRDLTVVDTETTERLREEIEARVRRVYDFDAEVGINVATRLTEAFAVVAARRRSFLAEHPEYARSERLSRSGRARLEMELMVVYDGARPELERLLGSALTDEEHSVLGAADYTREIGATLDRLIREAETDPVIADNAALEPDRERGITIQRVPDDGSPTRVIDNVETIATSTFWRNRLHDAVAVSLPDVPDADREVITTMLVRMAPPNLTLNRAATEIAREVAKLGVKPVKITIKKGEMVLRDGERITARHLLIFAAMSESTDNTSTVLVAVGGSVLLLILLAVGFGIGRGSRWSVSLGARDELFLAVLFIIMLVAARLWLAIAVDAQALLFSTVPVDAFLYLTPVAAGAIIVHLVLRTELAIFFAVVGSLILGVMVEERGFVAYALVGSVLGAGMIRTMSRRSDLLRAGVWVGVGQAAVAIALQLSEASGSGVGYLTTVSAALISGVLAAIVALAMTSVVEAVFGYTTDLELLELANLNHPALKDLIVQAPGSYHHSIIVGSLVEAAAEAIEANALLARVMAYYHDLGKGCNPAYFVENQRGSNPHGKLKPSMSAMVIRRHVTDGLDIAKRYGLGEQIRAAIVEHHGTTLIRYFYQKAKEHEDESNPVAESDYRYPGRKPQSRETAVVMLGDSVEAASRSLAEPTPARLQGLVNRIINMKFTDGQLDECDLTLKDLHTIAKAFSRILASIYHERPEYPGLLTDISGKKHDGDLDSKPAKKADASDAPPDPDRPDDIRRLGLD
ncbi:MAG: HDIG domain-containing metalloprotein [Myxococcota bacterium]